MCVSSFCADVILQAEHRLSAATSALDSLSSSMVAVEGDLVSLGSDVRVLEGRQAALEASLADKVGQVSAHEDLVHTRLQALRTNIAHIGADIVAKAKHTSSMQEDTVKFKQMVYWATHARMIAPSSNRATKDTSNIDKSFALLTSHSFHVFLCAATRLFFLDWILGVCTR